MNDIDNFLDNYEKEHPWYSIFISDDNIEHVDGSDELFFENIEIPDTDHEFLDPDVGC